MAVYILSKMPNAVNYRTYRMIGDANQKQGPLPVPVPGSVTIRGGADRPSQKSGFGDASEDINGNVLWTARGVVTKLTEDQYNSVKDHWLFKKHLDGGYLAVVGAEMADNHKKVAKVVDDMEGVNRDSPLTKQTVGQRINVKVPSKEVDQAWN